MATGALIFNALSPQSTSYDPQTEKGTFADFDVEISADETVITQSTNNHWTVNKPGNDVKLP